jgi:hypothetical protein
MFEREGTWFLADVATDGFVNVWGPPAFIYTDANCTDGPHLQQWQPTYQTTYLPKRIVAVDDARMGYYPTGNWHAAPPPGTGFPPLKLSAACRPPRLVRGRRELLGDREARTDRRAGLYFSVPASTLLPGNMLS